MRNLKRVLALALALVMILGMMVIGSSAASYSDAAAIDADYAEAVDVLTGMGVFKGTGAGFAPKAVLTRAEAATLIYRVITGDVKDAQLVNYKYSTFEDVAANEWYTGYITYASNGGYIKGYDGKAMPNDTVTGIQVMAIMLRAAGYGQNGEYEGEGWMDNILTDAKELGITGSIATSTLMSGATREVVAQLIFNAITSVNMVTYTPALGYMPVTWMNGNVDQVTLGYKVFGLTCGYGAIVGNQATGQDVTIIDLLEVGDNYYEYDYVVDSVYAEDFAIETGLDMFGHAVKVWYRDDANLYNYKVGAQVYAMYDETVKSAVVTGLTAADVKAAGFKTSSNTKVFDNYTVYSDAYNRFDKSLEKTYPIYVLIANDGYTVDAVIGVDAWVDTMLAVNNFLADPNALFAEAGLVEQADVKNFADAVLGANVIMERVAGTVKANSTLAYYMLDTLNNTTTAAVVGKNIATDDIILADGTTLSVSPLAGTGVLANTTMSQLVKGATYTFVLDNNGCYLYYFQNTTRAHFLATWMYYTMSGDLHDTYNYYIMGVNAAGETVKYEIDKATYAKLLPSVYGQKLEVEGTSAKNTAVVDLTLSKGKYAGAVCTEDDGHTFIGNTLTADAELVVGKGAQVVNNSYLVDENTTFYFVTGNASDLKVESYTGTTALVGNGTSYTLPADAMIGLSEIKTSVVATGNYHVDTVVVYGKYGYNYTGSMLYVEAGDPATGMIDLAGNVEINAWINGEAVQVYVPKANYDGICNHVKSTGHGQFFIYTVTGSVYTVYHNGYVTENVNYDLDCATATTGTIATIQVTDGTNFYNVGASTKIVTLPGVTKATGVKVADYANFANLAEAVATGLSTVESIEIDIALDGRGNVTTLYITNITLK